ncbi:M20 family metallopeptidase [Cohnella kolymensis]|uniref:M20 family metallopeptidase n=1 Tax=Cohnella kolymensis TaxID=1590652 RepID=UPI00126A58DC|nr:M20/M25/M40 family metallo-hydrolase [Cohnella kolymensis]
MTTHGKAAHSSVPGEGINAIVHMTAVIDYIHRSIEPELAKVSHPLCGASTISIGKISGGKQINIVPESCVIEVDRRIIPGEDPYQVMDAITRQLNTQISRLGIEHQIDTLLLDWALNTPIDARIVRSAQEAARRLGLNAAPAGATYGSDASKLQALKGIPSIVLGPGSINQAHTVNEWVPVSEVEQAVDFYIGIAESFGEQ